MPQSQLSLPGRDSDATHDTTMPQSGQRPPEPREESDVSMAEVLREMRETNRLLRALIVQQQHTRPTEETVNRATPQQSARTLQLHNPATVTSSTSIDRGTTSTLEAKICELLEDWASAAFDAAHQIGVPLRDAFISQVVPLPGQPQEYSPYYPWRFHSTLLSVKTRLGYQALTWISPYMDRIQGPASLLGRAAMTPDEAEEAVSVVRRSWPTTFDGQWKLEGHFFTSPQSQSLNSETFRRFRGFGLFGRPGGRLLPSDRLSHLMSEINTDPLVPSLDDLKSPGLFLYVAAVQIPLMPLTGNLLPIRAFSCMESRHTLSFDFQEVALICAILAGTGMSIPHALDSVRFFMGLNHVRLMNTLDLSGSIESRLCFSLPYINYRSSHLHTLFGSVPGIIPQRDFGNFVFLNDVEYSYEICRTFIIGHCSSKPGGLSPRFSIVVVDDGIWDYKMPPGQFANWEERGFLVTGPNAGHHFAQAVLHAALLQWEKRLGNTLDSIDRSLSTTVGACGVEEGQFSLTTFSKLRDIARPESSDSLLFDDGFARSKTYFKALQLLRLLGKATLDARNILGRFKPEHMTALLNPDRLFGVPEMNPMDDKVLLANWNILWKAFSDAEGRLVERINSKTEEIKSLRDGVGGL